MIQVIKKLEYLETNCKAAMKEENHKKYSPRHLERDSKDIQNLTSTLKCAET